MKFNHPTLASLLVIACTLSACDRQPTAEAATPTTTALNATTTAAAPQRVVEEPEPVCVSCGTVRSITPVVVEGKGSGVGAVIGGIVGGLAGNQIGGGSGRKIATVAGVVGGAVAGNKIEEKRNAESWYEVVVAMENGSVEQLTVPDASGISVGSEVTVTGDEIRLR